MVRPRIYGDGDPCLEWIRDHPELSSEYFCQTDIDAAFHADDVPVPYVHSVTHRYKTNTEGYPSRRLQFFMNLEIKSRNGGTSFSQRDTLWKTHKFLMRDDGVIHHDWQTWKHFGITLLRLSCTTPDDSDQISWGRFDNRGQWCLRPVSKQVLVSLLKFEYYPDSFQPLLGEDIIGDTR